jgi:hypothetical protein
VGFAGGCSLLLADVGHCPSAAFHNRSLLCELGHPNRKIVYQHISLSIPGRRATDKLFAISLSVAQLTPSVISWLRFVSKPINW